LQRFTAGQHHMTARELRAARTEAAFAGRSELRPQGMAVRKPAYLGEVPAAGGVRPAADARQHGCGGARARRRAIDQRELLGIILKTLEPVTAQVVRAPLE